MDQVADIVRLVTDVLGPDLVGVYPHGSSVHGGLRPASDVDVLVVTQRGMDDRQRAALLAGLLPISGSAVGARPVELTVVVRSEVHPWRYPPTVEFQYGEWLRGDYEAGAVPRPEPMPDLALLITNVLAGRRTLAGPPPAQVLSPVPGPDLVRASLAGIPALLDDLDADTRNVVLTLARIWFTVATGGITSKEAAAGWALERLSPEHRPVLAHARDLYRRSTYAEESWSDDLRAQVRPHVAAVLAAITEATG
ncbi:aminoglycoside adenylyltransferase family protein [Micromonospora sp. NPDC126480]|uniref:aminoglycoside adenylyltransferase family protein n=1 Tax=Micromonospora sp. NPDC126480 TaxID=3155312 RepID=UPI00331E7485